MSGCIGVNDYRVENILELCTMQNSIAPKAAYTVCNHGTCKEKERNIGESTFLFLLILKSSTRLINNKSTSLLLT